MEVKQIYTLVNTAAQETMGESVVLQEDLGNLVDVGKAILDSDKVDNYCRSLVNVIGRTVFVNRPYTGKVAKLRKEGWTYGSILRKIRVEPAVATENESWELQAGASYDPNIFTPPVAHEHFWNKRTTFEVPISITRMQVEESFHSAQEMDSFIGMINTMITNVLEKAMENLSRRTLNNLIAETVYNEYAATDQKLKSGIRAINLLYEFNNSGAVATPLSVAEALVSPDFIRFASVRMGETIEQMSEWTNIYNMEGTDKHTPKNRVNFFLLDKFKKRAGAYLYDGAGQMKTDYITLPESESISFWQGAGTVAAGNAFDFAQVSKIQVKTVDGHEITVSGVLGAAIDEEAAMICNEDRRITSGYNPKGEFFNYWHKMDCQYFNDYSENAVVFFIA